MPRDSYAGSQDHGTAGSEFGAVDFIIRRIMGRTATAALVQVKAVRPGPDGSVGVVDVQPMVGQLDGADNVTPHGVINNLPYLRLQGGSNAVIIDPKAGDIGIAWFAAEDISVAKITRAAAGPGSRRRFSMADGLYGGGVLNGTPTQFVRIDDDGITITGASGKPVNINAPGNLTITAPNVTINGSLTVSENVAVTGNTTVTGDLATGPGSTFNGKAFDSHTHSGVSTGSGHSGTPD